jgi:hypothetical protein
LWFLGAALTASMESGHGQAAVASLAAVTGFPGWVATHPESNNDTMNNNTMDFVFML